MSKLLLLRVMGGSPPKILMTCGSGIAGGGAGYWHILILMCSWR